MRYPYLATSLCACGLAVGPAGAVDLNILSMGDSLTYGVQSKPTGGYRESLSDLLTADGHTFSFLGPRTDATDLDPNWTLGDFSSPHFGYSGEEAFELEARLQDSGGYFNSNPSPDVLLLHIGTNSLNTGTSSVDDAETQLASLLDYLLDDVTSGLSGDTQIIVAGIIPKLTPSSTDPTYNRTGTWRSQQYARERVPAAATRDRVEFVDIFAFDVAGLDPAHFTPGDIASINTDADPWADWIIDNAADLDSPGVDTYDEGNVNRQGDSTGTDGEPTFAANPALWFTGTDNDAIHPDTLGYRVMSQAFFNAMTNLGLLAETGDLDFDGDIDQDDIDLLLAETPSTVPPSDEKFDLNTDALVDADDVTELVEVILGTRLGDLNLDGVVDGNDFGVFAGNFGVLSGAGYADGDLNGDGAIDGNDFGVFAGNFGFGATGADASILSSIPEPGTLALILVTGVIALRRPCD